MSRVTELAEAEAAAAEAESPDEIEDGDVTPADPPPDDSVRSDVAMRKALEAMERENERHAKRVAEIMGDDFAFVHVCPGCVDFAAGFTLTPPDLGPVYRQASDAQRCVECDGMGDVLTGAQVERGKFKACNACGGQGWTTKLEAMAPVVPMVQAKPIDPAAVAALREAGYLIIDPMPSAPAAGA